MFRYLKERYPEVFRTEPISPLNIRIDNKYEVKEILKSVESINKLHRLITKGDLQSLKILEDYSVDEYYNTINMFIMENKPKDNSEDAFKQKLSSRDGS